LLAAGVCIWQLIVEIDYQAAEIGILRNGSSERVIIEKLKTEQLKIVGEYTPEQTSLAQAGRALYHIIGGWQGARIELDTPKCKGIPYEFITYYLELSQGQGNELRPQNEFSEKKRWNGDGQFVRVMVDALQSYLADHGLATPQNNNHNPTVYNWNEVWKFLDPYKTNTEEVINE